MGYIVLCLRRFEFMRLFSSYFGASGFHLGGLDSTHDKVVFQPVSRWEHSIMS